MGGAVSRQQRDVAWIKQVERRATNPKILFIENNSTTRLTQQLQIHIQDCVISRVLRRRKQLSLPRRSARCDSCPCYGTSRRGCRSTSSLLHASMQSSRGVLLSFAFARS